MKRFLSDLRRLFMRSARNADRPKSPTGERERRQWPRIELRCQVTLRFPDTRAAIASNTLDISAGGLFAHVTPQRPLGTPVRVVLRIGTRTVDASGNVASVGPRLGGCGVGVSFTALSPGDQQWLETLISARPKV